MTANNQALLIEGYASLFDLRDLGGDIVRRGAFANSLKTRQHVPMLFQHEPDEPVGVWTDIREDQAGLYVRGEILPASARGRSVSALVRRRSVDGLSIGFRTRQARARPGGGRDLTDIDLWEVSIVTFPMLPQARLRLSSSWAEAA